MTETSNKPGLLFWIISILALVWNLFGVMVFTMQMTMSDEARAQLPELEQTMYANIPNWYMPVFGIAVFAGALGCTALLLRKKWALMLFSISFIAILAQQIYMFVLSDIGKQMNTLQLSATLSIPAIGLFLIWFTRAKIAKGWLN